MINNFQFKKALLKVFIGILSLLLVINVSIGQNRQIDSLKVLVAQSNEDTNRVIYINQLARSYYQFSPDSLEHYANKAMVLAQKLNYQMGIAKAHNNIGASYISVGDYQKALVSFEKYREIAQSLNRRNEASRATHNISVIYQLIGNYPKALEGFQESITNYEQLRKTSPNKKNLKDLAIIYNNVGAIYVSIGDYTKGMDYYLKSLQITKEIGILKHLSVVYMNLGDLKSAIGEYKKARVFFDLAHEASVNNNNKESIASYYTNVGSLLINTDSLDQALAYFKKSLAMHEELNNPYGKSLTLDAIGEIFLKKNKPDTALQYFTQSYNIRSHINRGREVAQSYINIARTYDMKKESVLALQAAHNAINTAQEIGNLKEIADAAGLLHTIYYQTGNPAQGLKYLVLHKNYSDSVFNKTKIKALSDMQSRYEISEATHKKELLVKENQLKEIRLNEDKSQLKIQKIILISSLIVICATIIFTSIIYRLYASRKKAHELLKQFNDEIIDQRDEIKTQAEMLTESNEEISTINESLKKTIQDRTQEILLQNTKIREYAFSNTHKIRTPVLELRKYVDEHAKQEINTKRMHQINDNILEKVSVLDQVTSQLAKFLNKNN